MPRKRVNRSVKNKIEISKHPAIEPVTSNLSETGFFGEQIPVLSDFRHYQKNDVHQFIPGTDFAIKNVNAHPQSSGSSTSWGDEFEFENTQRLQKEYNNIEKFLYDDNKSVAVTKEYLELSQWKQTYPQLRVVGKGINLPKTRFFKMQTDHEELIATHTDKKCLINCDTKTNSVKYYQDKLKQAVIDKICEDIFTRLNNKSNENTLSTINEHKKTPINSALRNRTVNPNLLKEQHDSFLRISPIPRQDVMSPKLPKQKSFYTMSANSSVTKWHKDELTEAEFSSLPYIPAEEPLLIKSAFKEVPTSAKIHEHKAGKRNSVDASKFKAAKNAAVILPPIENLYVSNYNQYRSISATPRSLQMSSPMSCKLYSVSDKHANRTKLEVGNFLVEENSFQTKQRSTSKTKRKRR